MIEDLLKSEYSQRYLPFVAGLLFGLLFISLGLWQMDRAAEKNSLMDQFAADAPYSEPTDYSLLEEFDRIEVYGQYLTDRQILIDNIPKDGRIGYYVITPFRPSRNDALVLVNRGWMPKDQGGYELPDLTVAPDFTTARGLAGHLPRVAIRPGEAFAVHGDWPRVALYPTLDDISAELGENVQPAVLLLGADADNGFVRRWEPGISGPMTHYSYAFQWFSMAAAVVLIIGWHLRKRWLSGQQDT